MGALDTIVEAAHAAGASDVHLAAGLPVRYRIDGQLRDANPAVLEAADCEELAREATGDAYAKIATMGEIDLAQTLGGVRCRLNIYRAQGNACLAIRLLADNIPPLSSLGLPPAVADFPRLRKGIVLVTGETGSGKSTTLASLLDTINHTRGVHIVTLEDPIEYQYTPDLASIDQREIGRDTESFATGLRAILREDPDVILVGEMRDTETIAAAITAAETGHLVFATLHTASAAESIDRLVDAFPEGRQAQIRMQLSTTLVAVLAQQLLPAKSGQGRVLACELMMVNTAIRNLIREGKTPQIANAIATSAEEGSITMDNMLIRMVRAGHISQQVAADAAHDRDYVARFVR